MNIYLILAVTALCFLFSCVQNYPPIEEYRLIRVVDGDTIYVKSAEGKRFKLRYIGIDCPEKGESFYYAASRMNKKLLQRGELRFEFDSQLKDQYGRLLAYVFIDDIMANAELLRLGLARLYDDPFNIKYRALFRKMEKEARLNSRGLWSKKR